MHCNELFSTSVFLAEAAVPTCAAVEASAARTRLAAGRPCMDGHASGLLPARAKRRQERVSRAQALRRLLTRTCAWCPRRARGTAGTAAARPASRHTPARRTALRLVAAARSAAARPAARARRHGNAVCSAANDRAPPQIRNDVDARSRWPARRGCRRAADARSCMRGVHTSCTLESVYSASAQRVRGLASSCCACASAGCCVPLLLTRSLLSATSHEHAAACLHARYARERATRERALS
jgi:hypothetical protein